MRALRVDGKTYHIKGETHLVGGTHNSYPRRGNAIYRATRGKETLVLFVFKNELGWVTSDRSQYGYMNMQDAIRGILR
jgi:hypothetical protein